MTERRAAESGQSAAESGRATDESEPPVESDGPPVEWRYDTTNSPLLRLVAHGFAAGLGGPLVLVGGALLLALPETLPELGLGAILFVALLVLVGGPFSLLYLWPMLVDADQRPSARAFTAEGETLPWTVRSTISAAVAGAGVLGGLALLGLPFDALFALVVGLLFSPVLVNLFSTVGRVEGGHERVESEHERVEDGHREDGHGHAEDARLVCNGRGVVLSNVIRVRSVRVGNVVACWVSYAPRTGTLVPRFLTMPADAADDVLAALGRGVDAEAPADAETDPAVRVIVGGAGLLFVGAAVVAVRATPDPVVRTYFGGVLGLVGVVLCVVGWRGV